MALAKTHSRRKSSNGGGCSWESRSRQSWAEGRQLGLASSTACGMQQQGVPDRGTCSYCCFPHWQLQASVMQRNAVQCSTSRLTAVLRAVGSFRLVRKPGETSVQESPQQLDQSPTKALLALMTK